jgi:streptomycin 6-kinase
MAGPTETVREAAQRLALRWGLVLGDEMPLASCSLVRGATGPGGEALVLKVPFPGTEERDSAWAVRSFHGYGGIRAVEIDESTGAILMPRLGMNLAEASLPEEQKVRICAGLIRTCHLTPLVARAVDLATWFSSLPPDASALIRDAWQVAKKLLGTAPAPVMLHGDLHHFNILLDGEEWRFIDPKGMFGDPAFEPCAYMRNAVASAPREELAKLMALRLKLFCESLPYPPARIWGWSFAQTAWCGNDCSPGDAKRDWERAAEALWGLRSEFEAA